MKNRFVLVLIIDVLLITVIIFAYIKMQKEKFLDSPVLDKTYVYTDKNGDKSCIKFLDKNKYLEDNCENNLSNMQFSGEFCKNFSYNKRKKSLTFICDETSGKENIRGKVEAKVIEWNNDKLILEYDDYYDGKVLNTFYSEGYLKTLK